MGRSILLGTDPAPGAAPARDTATLGPGDSSDSGSDLAGLGEDSDTGDPSAPVDVVLRRQVPHSLDAGDPAGGSDAEGTGERRSAVADAGGRDSADIGVDRVFSPGAGDRTLDDEDADLGFVDRAQAGDPIEDEEVSDDAAEIAAATAGGEVDEGAREDTGGTFDEDDGIPGAGDPLAQEPPLPDPKDPAPGTPEPEQEKRRREERGTDRAPDPAPAEDREPGRASAKAPAAASGPRRRVRASRTRLA